MEGSIISALTQVTNDLASCKLQNGRLIEANGMLLNKIRILSQSSEEKIFNLEKQLAELQCASNVSSPNYEKEVPLPLETKCDCNKSVIKQIFVNESAIAKQTGLHRPLSTTSFSSSIAELAEFDNPSAQNSPRIDQEDSPIVDGVGDEALLQIRGQRYFKLKSMLPPSGSPSSEASKEETSLGSKDVPAPSMNYRDQIIEEKLHYHKELLLNMRHTSTIGKKTLSSCLESINTEIQNLDTVINLEDKIAHSLTVENNNLIENNISLQQRIEELLDVIRAREEDILKLQSDLTAEEGEADEIAAMHEEEIGELINERDKIANQRDQYKEELSLSITNREIVISIEHQAAILEWKHKYDQMSTIKDAEVLQLKQQLIDAQHDYESNMRELTTNAIKNEHQITVLTHELEHVKKEKESCMHSAERKIKHLEHSLMRSGDSVDSMKDTPVVFTPMAITPIGDTPVASSHTPLLLSHTPFSDEAALDLPVPVHVPELSLKLLEVEDVTAVSPIAVDIHDKVNAWVQRYSDHFAAFHGNNELQEQDSATQLDYLMNAFGHAIVAHTTAMVEKAEITQELNSQIDILMQHLDAVTAEKDQMILEYEQKLRDLEASQLASTEEKETKIFEYEQTIEQLKYNYECCVRERDSALLGHNQELETVKHTLQQAVNERELIAIEYLQLMQSK